MTRNWRRLLLSAAAMLVLSVAIADDYDDGRELYKQGKYAEAVSKFEQAIKADPKNAKAYWQLNFAFNKLGKFRDALGAVQKAHALDPAHSFASDPSKYQETYDRLVQKAGGGSQTAPRPASQQRQLSQPTGRGSGSGNITQQLLAGDVYVEPGARVDVERLRRVAQDLKPAAVKFLVFNSRSGSATLAREAERVRTYLNLKDGYVIAASRAGVAAAAQNLNRNTLRDLTRQVAPMMEAGNFTEGLEKLARGLVTTRKAQAQATTNMWLFILIAIGGGVVLWVLFRRAKNASEIKALRAPLERQKASVTQSISFLDDQAALMPLGKGRVSEAREDAGRYLDQASKLIAFGKSANDFRRAKDLLDQAEGEVARAQAIINGAGEPVAAVGAGAARQSAAASANTDSGTDWAAIPESERGVCFFCSRPSRLNELTPVTVNLGDGSQKVLACAADLKTIKTGKMPNIRAFNDGGRQVPWYAYNGYDPYHDYYPRYGMGDYMRDMVTLSVIDSMFWGWHRPMGWGWGYGYPYTFYADHHYYHDWHSHHASDYADYGPDNAAGTDFLGGGASFGDSGGGTDFLGGGGTSFGDSGGGSDFLGGDAS